jgi:hypothetical protein
LFLLLLEEVPVVHAVVLERLTLEQVLEDAFQIPGDRKGRGASEEEERHQTRPCEA